MRWFSRYLGLICSLAMLAGGCASASGQQYSFHSYGQSEGLGNLTVTRIAFDHDGFLWIATENGLYRFLGSRFERYGIDQGLHERGIQDVFVDPAGRVWAATFGNLYRWNGRGFEPFDQTPTPIWGAGRIAARDERHLLVIRKRELVEFVLDAAGRRVSERPYYTAEQVKESPELAAPTSVIEAPDGTVWMGCRYKICSTRQGRVKVWGASEGVPALAENQDFWRSFQVGDNGSLWAVSARQIVELTSGAHSFTDRRAPGVELSGNTGLSPVLKDRQGRILRATDEGLARWDGSSWQRIEQRNGLPDGGPINTLAQDPNGDVWIGSASRGIWQWAGYENWEGWTRADGLPDNSVWSFAWPDAAHILIGTEKGPVQLDTAAHRITSLFATPGWGYGQVSGLAADWRGQRGPIWASTWTGKLLRIDPASRHVTEAGKIDWLSFGSVIRPDGGLLFLSRQGIYAVDHPELPSAVHPVTEVDALLDGKKAVPTHCSAANGDLWFLAENGLLRLRAGRWSKAKLRGFSFEHTDLKGLGCAGDGSLWIDGQAGESPGIWHLQQAAQGSKEAETPNLEATRIPTPAFLREAELMSLLVDKRGWLWMGTDVGTAIWNGLQWRHATQENGLIWNDANQSALQEAPDGSIWIGTSGGVAHVLHPESTFAPQALTVAITTVRRYNQSFLPGERIEFPWSRIPVRFSFASPAGWNRSALEFHYRIAGANPAWIATQETEAALPTLLPGNYRFEVFAVNPESGVSSPVAGVEFRIRAPWWLQWWFVVLCLAAVGALLWLALWLRTRNLIAGQRRLEALVRERTSELELSRESLRIQATHDTLTGLFNRGVVLSLLDQEVERRHRDGRIMAVLLVDIDYFKRVNDTHGHLAGDEVLRCFAEELKKSIRPYDHVGRYGGEEFLMLIGNLPVEEVEKRLAGIHAGLTDLAVQFEGREIRITCSIGASFIAPGNAHVEVSQVLSAADRALYEAKRSGRNRVVQADLSGTGKMSVVVAQG